MSINKIHNLVLGVLILITFSIAQESSPVNPIHSTPLPVYGCPPPPNPGPPLPPGTPSFLRKLARRRLPKRDLPAGYNTVGSSRCNPMTNGELPSFQPGPAQSTPR